MKRNFNLFGGKSGTWQHIYKPYCTMYMHVLLKLLIFYLFRRKKKKKAQNKDLSKYFCNFL